MTVVTFENYTPSARYDGIPYTKAVIQEAPLRTGPWTTREIKVFADPDADPSDPKTRNFTTSAATLEAGWYRILFEDNIGAQQQPTAPEFNGPKLEYEPTVDQVARKILSRTRDKYGNLLGTFNNDTAPTDLQVQEIISDTVTEIADVIGDDIPDALIDDAQNVASLRAAMQIELDYYADQVNTDRSPYNQLKELYDEALEKLAVAVTSAEDGEVVNSSPATRPSYSFPEHGIGYGTVW